MAKLSASLLFAKSGVGTSHSIDTHGANTKKGILRGIECMRDGPRVSFVLGICRSERVGNNGRRVVKELLPGFQQKLQKTGLGIDELSLNSCSYLVGAGGTTYSLNVDNGRRLWLNDAQRST